MIGCSHEPPKYRQNAAMSQKYRISSALVDLARQDRGKFIGKALQPLGLPIHL
jgi:hypothetical protein